jgi:hypothetical protein
MSNMSTYENHPDLRRHLARACADAVTWREEGQAFNAWFTGDMYGPTFCGFQSPGRELPPDAHETLRRLDRLRGSQSARLLALSLRLRAVLPADFHDAVCTALSITPLDRLLLAMRAAGWVNHLDDRIAGEWVENNVVADGSEKPNRSPVSELLLAEFQNPFHRLRRHEQERLLRAGRFYPPVAASALSQLARGFDHADS